MRALRTVVVAAALQIAALAGPIIVLNDFASNFGRLDLGTGIYTPIGTTDAGELVNGPGGGVFGFRENGDWVSVAGNGGTTTLGNSGLAIDEPARLLDGTIYATDLSHNLYRVNPANGAPTLVGSTGFVDPAGGFFAVILVGGDTNTLYAVATSFDSSTFTVIDHAKLYQINRATGMSTFVANVDNDAVTCVLLLNNTAYAFDLFAGVSTLNLATGHAASIYDLTVSLEGIHGVAAIPEPSSASMMVLACAAIYWRLRRR